MVKDKLHTINDEDTEAAARLLLVSSKPYKYIFDKIERQSYDQRHGTDAEEAVNVYFHGKVEDPLYLQVGWKDVHIMVQLIEHDRYHDYPYFHASEIEVDSKEKTWRNFFISNHIEAIEFLQTKELI